jgi:purine-binding chemotaxis protein CheW
MNADDQAAGAAALAGKYMTFKLAAEEYGLPILKVRELIGMLDVTRVPGSPDFVRGVINLRGRVVPVIDLRTRFGLPVVEYGPRAVIVVVQVAAASGPLTLGVLVDEVLEVRDLAADQVEPPPGYGERTDEPGFVLGVGKSGRRVLFLLDIDRVLTTSEVIQLQLDREAA